MPRLRAINPDDAHGRAKDLLQGVHARLGMTPNMMRTMANAPAVLDAYLAFSGALARGSLSTRLREQIALTVAEANGCGYCLAAHSALGKAAGLSEEAMQDSRRGIASDSRASAALRFARRVVEERGWVTDADLGQVRRAEFTDGEIAEIVANVAVNLFTNYFNHVVDTDVDFPPPSVLDAA
jgi:uncharacterized peroxidase-related enzyme